MAKLRSYNAQDQVTSSTTTAGTTSYGYTLAGSLASVTPPGGGAQSYTTDAYGWVATAPGGLSYSYDALGRLATRTASGTATSMSYLARVSAPVNRPHRAGRGLATGLP